MTAWCLLLICAVAHLSHCTQMFPQIRVFKQSIGSTRGYLARLATAPFNHEFVGASKNSDSSPSSSFSDLQREVRVGSGSADFEKASKLLFSFAMINELPWAEVVGAEAGISVGDTIGTLVKCYKLVWSLNPCRITSVRREERVSEVAFSTLSGHLIAGEERFRVIHHEDDDSVMFTMYSFTKGATTGPGILGVAGGIVGRLAMPFIRPLQRRFFSCQAAAMLSLMKNNATLY